MGVISRLSRALRTAQRYSLISIRACNDPKCRGVQMNESKGSPYSLLGNVESGSAKVFRERVMGVSIWSTLFELGVYASRRAEEDLRAKEREKRTATLWSAKTSSDPFERSSS